MPCSKTSPSFASAAKSTPMTWCIASKQVSDYNPVPDLEKIQAAVLAINFADDELNPPALGIVDRAKQRVGKGQFVLIPASSQTEGHMTLLKASIYEPFVADFLAKLPATH
jgi:homoserine O-acetyltransferase